MSIKIYDAEYRFMELLWEHGPINSTMLVKLCHQELGWKKSTTYTTIRRLIEREIIKSEDAQVSYLVTQNDVRIEASKEHLNKLYQGSLNLFLTSFLQKENLTDTEAQELKALIDQKVREGE